MSGVLCSGKGVPLDAESGIADSAGQRRQHVGRLHDSATEPVAQALFANRGQDVALAARWLGN
jgi:hypothetical protein